MKIGKPKRKFLIRIIDLDTQKSVNFSVYQEEGENLALKKFSHFVRKAIERGLRGFNE